MTASLQHIPQYFYWFLYEIWSDFQFFQILHKAFEDSFKEVNNELSISCSTFVFCSLYFIILFIFLSFLTVFSNFLFLIVFNLLCNLTKRSNPSSDTFFSFFAIIWSSRMRGWILLNFKVPENYIFLFSRMFYEHTIWLLDTSCLHNSKWIIVPTLPYTTFELIRYICLIYD